MQLDDHDVQLKMEKLSRSTETLQFALSPEGFLLVNNGKVIEVCDFSLFCNGQYCRRNGFECNSNFQIPKNGMYLCSFGDRKFIARSTESWYEYASSKKVLSPEFCLVLQMRFSGRIVLLLADGDFSSEAHLITLSDNSSNELFSSALARKLIGAHNQDTAQIMYSKQEENTHVEEE